MSYPRKVLFMLLIALLLVSVFSSCDFSLLFGSEPSITSFVIRAADNPEISEDIESRFEGQTIYLIMHDYIYAQKYALRPTIEVGRGYSVEPAGKQVFFDTVEYDVVDRQGRIVLQYQVLVDLIIN
jgi:hypothetical protein